MMRIMGRSIRDVYKELHHVVLEDKRGNKLAIDASTGLTPGFYLLMSGEAAYNLDFTLEELIAALETYCDD